MSDGLGERATAVVIRDGMVLLVRNRPGGRSEFMMPGGAIEPGESPRSAAVRELREETGLEATKVEYLFTWDSSVFRHHVFRIEAEGEVTIEPEEIAEFRWWDQEEEMSMFGHVKAILGRT